MALKNRDVWLNILHKLRDLNLVIDNTLQIAQVLTREIPVILEQPQSYVGPAGPKASFTVIAENVADYQWQAKDKEGTQWTNSSAVGNKTNTMSRATTTGSSATQFEYRCKITGIDNSVIYSDVVDITIVEG